MDNVEIERKWEMDGFPDLAVEFEAWQEQGYLVLEPFVLRIRKTTTGHGSTYRLAIKSGKGLARTEVELDMNAGQYAALQPLLAAPPARKIYRTYRLPGGERLECSHVDEGEPTSFFYAEVEFESLAAAHAFRPPAFLGRELTGQAGASMHAYCMRKAGGPE